MRVSELTGAMLDYWVARAEGVPAADLELGANGTLCVLNLRVATNILPAVRVLDYSTNWALTGPVQVVHGISCIKDYNGWWSQDEDITLYFHKDKPLITICRAVVRAAFGDEVEDWP